MKRYSNSNNGKPNTLKPIRVSSVGNIDEPNDIPKKKEDPISTILKTQAFPLKNYLHIKLADLTIKLIKDFFIQEVRCPKNFDFKASFLKIMSDPKVCKIVYQQKNCELRLDNCYRTDPNENNIKHDIPSEILFWYKNKILVYGKLDEVSYEYSFYFLKYLMSADEFINDILQYVDNFVSENSRYGVVYTDGTNNNKEELKSVADLLYYSNTKVNKIDYKHYEISETKPVYDYIKWFIENKKLYNEKLKICWKTGIALHGDPGTGKTEIIRYTAKKLDIPIWIFDLKSLDMNSLQYYISCARNAQPSIILFEDFDRLFDENKKFIELDSGLTLDNILNLIDGIGENDGIITILTCNHINNIDPAMVNLSSNDIVTRPGRIDRAFKINKLSYESRLLISKSFFEDEDYCINLSKNNSEVTFAQFRQICLDILYGEIQNV